MGNSTVYDVKVRYSMESRGAQTGVRGLTEDTKRLGQEVKRTSGMFGKLAASVAATFGARMAGKALIGFNATVEDTKNQIAGMLALTKKTDLADQLGNADRLFANLQRRAKSLPGTTAEYTRMAGMLAGPISDAGGTLKNLEDLTVNSTVAAKALGIQWDVAARDIDQALRGQFHSTDVFAGKVLGSMGYKGEEGRKKFNEMSAEQRYETLSGALMQKQFTQLGAAAGNTFAGQLATLQDTLEQTLGKIGLPLFKAITNELKTWNAWADKNGDKIEEFAKTVGEGLVKGFTFVKDAIGFLVEHADTLLTIGKVWAGVKIGGMLADKLGSSGSGIVGSLAGAFGAGGFFDRGVADKNHVNMNTGQWEHVPGRAAGRGFSAVGGLKGAASNLGLLGQAAGAGLAIGTLINDATGLSKSLAGAVEWNGKLYDATDKTTMQMLALEKQSHALDKAMEQQRKTITGSTAIANLRGSAANNANTANLINDVIRAREALDAAKGSNKFGANMGGVWDAQNRLAAAEAAAEAAGLSTGGFTSWMRDDARRAGDQGGMLSSRADAASVLSIGAFQVGIRQLTEYQRKTLDTEKAQEALSSYMVQQLAKGEAFNPKTVMEILKGNTADPEGKHKSIADKPKVNVTIQRIEVQSDDPDRMAFGLLESFREAAKNPSSALNTLREG